MLSQKQKVPDDAAAVVLVAPLTPLLPGEQDAMTEVRRRGRTGRSYD